MNVLNFGSLNIDYVYKVPHIVKPGETIKAFRRNIYAGGRGLNQSIAMARAGLHVFHAGCVGKEAQNAPLSEKTILLSTLQENNVNIEYIKVVEGNSGHTVIQEENCGSCSIMIYNGANYLITKSHIDEVLHMFKENDLLVLQNEINNLSYIMEKANTIGMKILFNPSPYTDDIKDLPINLVTYFAVNEFEGRNLFNTTENDEIITNAKKIYPDCNILLTLGDIGALYYSDGVIVYQSAYMTKIIDTTVAGDTFLGYFVHGLVNDVPMKNALDIAAKAASIAISRHGAADTIPSMDELRYGRHC